MSGYEVSFTCETDPGALDRLFVVVDAGAVGADRTMITVWRQADKMISVDPGHLIAMERRIAELEVKLAEAEISALFAAVEAGLISTRAAGVTP